MLRVSSLIVMLSMLLGACAMPSPADLPDLIEESHVRPGYLDRINHRLLWLSPNANWHDNCLFLKPVDKLTHDEQIQVLPNADVLYRAHFEERRMAYRSAVPLYRQAADKGIALAYVKLGNLFLDGRGVKYNPKEGAALVLQSARLDCAEAQHRYADLLTKGKGVQTNLIEAWAWAEMSRMQGYPGSVALQKKMEGVMAPGQVQLAHQKSRTLREQLDLFNKGAVGKQLVKCRTAENRKPFLIRMRACHAMGGTHQEDPF